LSPVQVAILPIGEAHRDYAQKVFEILNEEGIRVELDQSDEGLGKKIRNAKVVKTPYLLVIGDKEVESETVTVESRNDEKLGAMKLEEFLSRIQREIKEHH